MNCEICGRKIHGPTYSVLIDGAKLIVCSKCAAFSSSSNFHQLKTQEKKHATKPSSFRSRTSNMRRVEELELVEDYGKRIKIAREKLGLSQKELGKLIREKSSFLQKLETGKTVPNITLAKKLEKSLKIILLVKPSYPYMPSNYVVKKPPELTLEDIVNFKSKKKLSEVED